MTEEQIIKLWGEDLYNVFSDHINDEGWLTENWADIIEEEIPKFDEDWNDNELYTDTYGSMYNIEFESNEDETLIRPISPVLS